MPHARIYRIPPPCRQGRMSTCGFKAGQSHRGRIGYRVECSQTLAAGMSALEPTVVVSFRSRDTAGAMDDA